MKWAILIAVLLVMVGYFLSTPSTDVPKPDIPSVVIEGKSYCEKRGDMVLDSVWERLCRKEGKDNGCDLTRESAQIAYANQMASIQLCHEEGN